MNQFEIYLLLFTDVLTSNFAFNASSELVLNTMKSFGNYNNWLILLVAIIAYIFSVCINYIFGTICYKILAPATKNEGAVEHQQLSKNEDKDNNVVKNKSNIEINKKISNIQNFKFLPLIIAISFVPFFGKFIILLSGFCRVNFKTLFMISIFTKFVYYSFLIFST